MQRRTNKIPMRNTHCVDTRSHSIGIGTEHRLTSSARVQSPESRSQASRSQRGQPTESQTGTARKEISACSRHQLSFLLSINDQDQNQDQDRTRTRTTLNCSALLCSVQLLANAAARICYPQVTSMYFPTYPPSLAEY